MESSTPAELTRMWMGELKVDSAVSKRCLTWSGSEMSAWIAMARGDVEVADELILVARRLA